MAISIVNQPSDCLNAVQSPLEFQLQTDSIVKQAANVGSVQIVFQAGTVADGDYFEVLGKRIVFKTTATEDFEISISSYQNHADAFQIIMGSAYEMIGIADLSRTDNPANVVFTITMNKCGEMIDFTTFSGVSTAVSVTDANTYQALELKSDYRSDLMIDIDGVTVLRDISTYFLPQLDTAKCTVATANSSIDISTFIRTYFNTSFPSLDSSHLLQSELSRNVQVGFFEYWTEEKVKRTANVVTSVEFRCLNAKIKKVNDFFPLTDFCNDSDEQRFLTFAQDGSNIGCDEFKWIYVDIKDIPVAETPDTDTGSNPPAPDTGGEEEGDEVRSRNAVNTPTADVLQWTFWNGPSVAYTKTETISNGGFYEVAVGVRNFESELQASNINPSDVSKITITLAKTLDSGLPQSVTINFNVDCCEKEKFLFLSSHGTYESILLNPHIESKVSINKKTIQLANTSHKETITNSTSRETFKAFFQNVSAYGLNNAQSLRLIEEMQNSREVYWCKDGVFYPIYPTTRSYTNYSVKEKLEIPFEWKFYETESLNY